MYRFRVFELGASALDLLLSFDLLNLVQPLVMAEVRIKHVMMIFFSILALLFSESSKAEGNYFSDLDLAAKQRHTPILLSARKKR
jgi:hypothetical protein